MVLCNTTRFFLAWRLLGLATYELRTGCPCESKQVASQWNIDPSDFLMAAYTQESMFTDSPSLLCLSVPSAASLTTFCVLHGYSLWVDFMGAINRNWEKYFHLYFYSPHTKCNNSVISTLANHSRIGSTCHFVTKINHRHFHITVVMLQLS